MVLVLKKKKKKCAESIFEFGFCGSGSVSNCGKKSIDQSKSITKVLFAQSKGDLSSLC